MYVISWKVLVLSNCLKKQLRCEWLKWYESGSMLIPLSTAFDGSLLAIHWKQ